MEAREIMARRAPSLEERINALRDKGVVIGGTTYRYNFAQISAATGVSRSMISMFANGNIRIKPEQQKILEDWVSDIERQAQEEAIETGAVEETPAPAPQTFKRNIELYQTHEFTEALGLLEWTRDQPEDVRHGRISGHRQNDGHPRVRQARAGCACHRLPLYDADARPAGQHRGEHRRKRQRKQRRAGAPPSSASWRRTATRC